MLRCQQVDRRVAHGERLLVRRKAQANVGGGPGPVCLGARPSGMRIFVSHTARQRAIVHPPSFESPRGTQPGPPRQSGRTRMPYQRCSSCSGGQKACANCGGQGTPTCAACGGRGQSGWGDNASNCSACGGSGRSRCSSCGGGGRIVCTSCGGSGSVWVNS